jgi:deoxyribonuclease IV
VPPRKPSPVGAHVPVAGGLATGGLAYARLIGAEAVQVFVSNPRGWAASAGDPAQDTAFRAGCEAARIPAYVHAPYLINLGSPSETTLRQSVGSLAHALRRGRDVGARGVVVHTGSAVDGTYRDAAMKQIHEHVLPLLEELPDDGPDLLLEPTAGQGQSLCGTVDQLGPYLDALELHPRVGVCLDTCHAFAAGHDLAAPGGVRTMLNTLVRVAGRGRLRLVHANDSKDVVGACKDRHENIGRGHIGEEPFAELFRHPATRGVPVIVETPGKAEDNHRDVALLKALRDR